MKQSTLAPENPYGRTKAVAESVVRALEGRPWNAASFASPRLMARATCAS